MELAPDNCPHPRVLPPETISVSNKWWLLAFDSLWIQQGTDPVVPKSFAILRVSSNKVDVCMIELMNLDFRIAVRARDVTDKQFS